MIALRTCFCYYICVKREGTEVTTILARLIIFSLSLRLVVEYEELIYRADCNAKRDVVEADSTRHLARH